MTKWRTSKNFSTGKPKKSRSSTIYSGLFSMRRNLFLITRGSMNFTAESAETRRGTQRGIKWNSICSSLRVSANLCGKIEIALLLALIACVNADAEDKINYQEHVLPLIEANCSKCHNADKKKADLDLTSYQDVLQGSGSGPVLVSGNPDGSKLWKAITHAEEPNRSEERRVGK